MEFELLFEPLGTLAQWVVRNRASRVEIAVLAGYGAAWNRWRVPHRHKDELIDLVEVYSSEEDLRTRFADTSFGSRLAPYPNRTQGGKWSWRGAQHSLELNFKWQPHSIHGLVRTEPWQLVRYEDMDEYADVEFRIKWNGSSPTPHIGFPYDFALTSRYRLHADGAVEIRSQVQNTMSPTKEIGFGSGAVAQNSNLRELGFLPYGEGWHPYFIPGCAIDQAEITFPARAKLQNDDHSIPTGTIVDSPLQGPIGEQFLDGCWVIESGASEVSSLLYNPIDQLEIRVWQECGRQGYRYLQLYTPPSRRSLAIEPMTCPPNALNSHTDLWELAPGDSKTLHWGAACTWIDHA